MKKTVFYFVLLAGIAVSFSSCLSLLLIAPRTYKMVVDETVPEDQTVIITFYNHLGRGWFELKEWNNEWNSKEMGEILYGSPGVGSNDKTQLTVPAGNNRFIFNAYYSIGSGNSSTNYQFINIELRYDLEQEKKYLIKGSAKPSDSGKGYGLFVGIFDVTGKQELLLKEWKLGETN